MRCSEIQQNQNQNGNEMQIESNGRHVASGHAHKLTVGRYRYRYQASKYGHQRGKAVYKPIVHINQISNAEEQSLTRPYVQKDSANTPTKFTQPK